MKKFSLLLITLFCIGFIYIPSCVYAEGENTEEIEKEQFNVTFDSNGGTSVNAQKVEKDKTVARPTNPTREGYTFREWQLNNTTYNFNTKVESDITLIAVWDIIKVAPTSSYLESLKIDNLDFDQVFGKTNGNYTITVPADTKSINIIATPDENSAILKGTGKFDLKDGKNTFQVITKLKETNDKEKTYTIVVTRETPDITLESLRVTGFALKEAFESTLYQYSLEVPYDVEEVNVVAKATNSNASVTVTGGKNLVVGENTVTVTVTYSTGTKQDYKIIVTRLLEDDKSNIEPVQSDNTTSEIVPPVTEDDKDNKNSAANYVLIIVGIILILALSGLGIFFYLKSETPEKKKARLEKKKNKMLAKEAKVNKEVEPAVEEIAEVEEVTTELEQTKEAPIIDHSDILDGIEELLDETKE